MTVSELLTNSRSAHAAYRTLKPRVAVEAIRDQIALAYDFRQQAHDADPDHGDPAWADDKASHGDLMAFYRGKLGLVDVVENGQI